MKTWTELQEWVEVSGRAWAIDVANLVKEGKELTKATEEIIDDLRTRGGFELGVPHSPEYELIYAALAWKASELIAERFTGLAEGWCEAYYRDLKRMYGEEL